MADRKRRLSVQFLTQDCIEWNETNLQDPRKLADPNFNESVETPQSDSTDSLTPVVRRRRRRRPLGNRKEPETNTHDLWMQNLISTTDTSLPLKETIHESDYLMITTEGPENINARTTNVAVKKQEEDEFDDMDDSFTEDDLAQMDSLVQSATQAELSPVPRNDTSCCESKSNVGAANVQSLFRGRIHNPTVQTCPSTAAAPDEDEFEDDDIPDDFDVDAIVAATQTQSFITPHSAELDDFDYMDDIDTAALDRIVAAAAPGQLSFTRYTVIGMHMTASLTRSLLVASWTDAMVHVAQKQRTCWHRLEPPPTTPEWTACGEIHLHGRWYYNDVQVGDVIHVCSLQGQTATDVLPLTLGMDDSSDLVMVAHPDCLLPPTTISEGVVCPRRSVLKSRLGSSGLTSMYKQVWLLYVHSNTPYSTAKSALYGTLRHGLMEQAMRQQDFSVPSLTARASQLVREKAEDILSCQASSRETELEILKALPQLQRFGREFTSCGGGGNGTQLEDLLPNDAGPTHFLAQSTEAVEETIICPELGLKGNVDMIVHASSSVFHPQRLSGIELKTSHNQNHQPEHSGQLLLYILMMRTRYGSQATSDAGVLLYLNNESIRAFRVTSALTEVKNLLCLRNDVAIAHVRASKLRGVELSYENGSRQTPSVQLLDSTPVDLPERLSNPHQCKRCYSNRECMLFEASALNGRSSSNSDELLSSFTGHLSPDELAYFRHWDRLVDFEAHAEESAIAITWLLGAHELEQGFPKSIGALSYVTNSSAVQELDRPSDSQFCLLRFHRQHSTSRAMLSSLGLDGHRVVVSCDTTTTEISSHQTWKAPSVRPQMHLVRGDVVNSTDDHITIRVDHDGRLRIEKLIERAASVPLFFRLDHDRGATGMGTLRQNLVNFLTADKKANREPGTLAEETHLSRLRRLVIRLEKPVFHAKVALFRESSHRGSVCGCSISELSAQYTSLNPDQQHAVEKVVSARDYALIQGLPGTGKTSTIAFLVRLLVAQGKRVLVTSYTHSAVDNILMKLLESGMAAPTKGSPLSSLVRIDKYGRCHSSVRPVLAQNLAAQLENDIHPGDPNLTKPSAESLRKVISFARVVGVSALTVPKSPLLLGEEFDVVIVDEAGQISQPAVLGALMAAESFVLVGDHMQLPPLAVSELSTEGGFCVSLLRRLAEAHESAVAQLTLQYRMHQDICQISNDIVYNGDLKCANEWVANRTLSLGGFPENLPPLVNSPEHMWIRHALDPTNATVFLDTDQIKSKVTPENCGMFHPLEKKGGGGNGGRGGIVNETEANVTRTILRALFACGLDATSIGIIVPFKSQLRFLEGSADIVSWKSCGLELSTIDSFQGRDKPVIILSFVRSNEKGNVGRLLQDFRRLNVAVTRAKCKLLMIGSFSTLEKGSDLTRKITNRVKLNGRVFQLPQGILVQT